MKITHSLEAKDYIYFNLFQIQHSEQLKKRLHIQRLVVSIIFVVMALLAFSLLSRFRLTVAAIFLLASVFWYAYFPTFSKNQVVKSTEKTMARGQLTSLFDEVQLEFDAISVKEMTTQGTHINNWQDIESIRITKEYFYLFLTSTSAIIIPKRTLAVEEMDELKGLIDKYYQGNIEQIDK